MQRSNIAPIIKLGFSYRVTKNARSRTLRLSVLPNGLVRVTIPRHVSIATADVFVASNVAWVRDKLEQVHSRPASPFTPEHYRRHKPAARAHITAIVERYARAHNLFYSAITIRHQKSCWGSCSRRKTLSFNYKLMFLPTVIQDYVVVHELCHLKELNHSRGFWLLVQSILPDYAQRRAELRRLGIRYQ